MYRLLGSLHAEVVVGVAVVAKVLCQVVNLVGCKSIEESLVGSASRLLCLLDVLQHLGRDASLLVLCAGCCGKRQA